MMMFMPLMFGYMFYFASAGLVLYWLTGNVVGIVQQWLLNKTHARARSDGAGSKYQEGQEINFGPKEIYGRRNRTAHRRISRSHVFQRWPDFNFRLPWPKARRRIRISKIPI